MRSTALLCVLYVATACGNTAIPTLGRIHSADSSLSFSMVAPIPDSSGVYPLHRPGQPCRVNNTRHENLCIRRLTSRVARLELALSAICSSIINADDVAFSERAALGIGHVYQDFNLTARRRPRWLRRSVQDVATIHNIQISPPQTHWQHRDIVSELDAEP